jgi:hypothetical protein
MPPVGTRRTCLLVNDENKNAQLATIDGDRLVVGDPIVLIRDEPDTNPKKTLGKAPDVGCPKGVGDFGKFDGEGVAYSGPFFLIGSHGCSRNSEKFRLSSFMLARIRVDLRAALLMARASRCRPTLSTGEIVPGVSRRRHDHTATEITEPRTRGSSAPSGVGQEKSPGLLRGA